MTWHGRFRAAPPWWPANEPWPPTSRSHLWRRGRARFVRRIALVFGALLFLSAVGATSLVSMLVHPAAAAAPSVHLPPGLLPVIVGVLITAVLITVVARLGGGLGDIVEAANRVANGDYSTRIALQGPPTMRAVGSAVNTMTSRLQAQERQRRDLMADIAHELRTPLTVIQGRLEGLLDGIYPRDDERLGAVLEETRMLARLVEDLRTLANAESGILSLEKEPTDLTMLVREVAGSFSTDAASHRIAVRSDVPTAMPPIAIDPVRIREVIANLVSNAIHHTPAGGVVSIAVSPSDQHTTVTVSDTGPGISPEDLAKIFDRFYKGSASRGTGLGLTIARNLVTAHGGTIRADSQPGQGTTITLTLPTDSPTR